MTHEQIRERLLDLAYDELSPGDAREVEEHAAACEACAAELVRIRGTRHLMGALPQEPAPAGGERVLLAAAREAARLRERPRRIRRWVWAVSVAASLATVAAVSHRILTARHGDAGRDDAQALMGEGRPAYPPPESARGDVQPLEREGPAGGVAKPPEKRAAPTDASGRGRRRDAPARTDHRSENADAALDVEAAPAPREPPRFAAAPPAERAPAPPPPPATRGEASPFGASGSSLAESQPPAPRSPSAGVTAAPALESRAPSGSPSARAQAKASAPAPAAQDAVARYEELRRSGRLRGEVRTFPGCAGELWRKVERDPDGGVVAYAREELAADGRRVRVEVIYGPDGVPVRITATDAATSGPLERLRPWVPSAGDADGPPRCGPSDPGEAR